MVEIKAKLSSIAKKYKSTSMIIAFEVDDISDAMIEEIENKVLRLEIKQWREKRSLDSNAYMWLLTSRIAERVNSTIDAEHKRQMLEYGRADLIDGEPVIIRVQSRVNMDRVDGYWRFYDAYDDWKEFYKLKPSHEFDTKEMSDFLEHVIEEAKELGIETATPDELARMEALYGKKVNKRSS